MEKILKIETEGTSLLSYIGYVKEKDAEKILRQIKNQYTFLNQRHGDRGNLKVNITTYNPELPWKF